MNRKCGVTQTETEWEQSRSLVFLKTAIAYKDIFLIIHLLVDTRIGLCTILHIRIVLITLGECDWQLTTWADRTCKNIDEG